MLLTSLVGGCHFDDEPPSFPALPGAQSGPRASDAAAAEADGAERADAAARPEHSDAGASDLALVPARFVVDPALTLALAPLAGPQATPAVGQEQIGFYGTDLGFTVAHGGQLRIVFGDTWAEPLVPVIGPVGDDCQGVICLAADGCPAGGVALPDGDAVEAYTGTTGAFAARRGPPLVFRMNDFAKVAPIPLYAGGLDGTLLDALTLKTPMAAFSNGKGGDLGTVVGLFGRGDAVPCGACESGFRCDTSLGVSGTAPCARGTLGCSEAPGGGICVDETSPRYDAASAEGRLRGAVFKSLVGNADPVIQERYYTRVWNTHKFFNPAAVTVTAYEVDDQGRGASHVENPTPAHRVEDGRDKVFVWGRPSFVGVQGASAKLYLAVVENPDYRADGEVPWEPRYFAGLDEHGAPRFAEAEADAQALKNANGSDEEPLDIVNQLSVRYVPALSTWLMMYGGDLEPGLFAGATQGQAAAVQRDPAGAIQVRFADEPWGPWSAPQPLLLAGDPELPAMEYGPGGLLHQEQCTPADACAPGEAFWELTMGREQRGYLYAPNLISEWTEDRGDGVDLYWNVSTFSPYQVVLMRSTIRRATTSP